MSLALEIEQPLRVQCLEDEEYFADKTIAKRESRTASRPFQLETGVKQTASSRAGKSMVGLLRAAPDATTRQETWVGQFRNLESQLIPQDQNTQTDMYVQKTVQRRPGPDEESSFVTSSELLCPHKSLHLKQFIHKSLYSKHFKKFKKVRRML